MKAKFQPFCEGSCWSCRRSIKSCRLTLWWLICSISRNGSRRARERKSPRTVVVSKNYGHSEQTSVALSTPPPPPGEPPNADCDRRCKRRRQEQPDRGKPWHICGVSAARSRRVCASTPSDRNCPLTHCSRQGGLAGWQRKTWHEERVLQSRLLSLATTTGK
jgi:hypothetical protein